MAQCFGNEEDTSGKGRQMPVVRLIAARYLQFTRCDALSTSAPLRTTFTPSLLPSQPRFPKLRALRTLSAEHRADARTPSPHVSLVKEPHQKEVRPTTLSDGIFCLYSFPLLDFHAGLMLASTIPSPTLFIARNNGFAISTPSTEQYNGDGIASRGPGYGIDTIRVDGNDILAVISAVREGRRRCLEQGRAVLIEAMSYRSVNHSSTTF